MPIVLRAHLCCSLSVPSWDLWCVSSPHTLVTQPQLYSQHHLKHHGPLHCPVNLANGQRSELPHPRAHSKSESTGSKLARSIRASQAEIQHAEAVCQPIQGVDQKQRVTSQVEGKVVSGEDTQLSLESEGTIAGRESQECEVGCSVQVAGENSPCAVFCQNARPTGQGINKREIAVDPQ